MLSTNPPQFPSAASASAPSSLPLPSSAPLSLCGSSLPRRRGFVLGWTCIVLMAIIGILAMAFANYAEDRRTLALLRIRGAGPRDILQFLSAGLSAPAVIGLIFGGLIALLVGFGITNFVWQLREIKTIMLYLHTRLAVSWQTASVAVLLIGIVIIIALFFSRWIFKRTARESLSDQ